MKTFFLIATLILCQACTCKTVNVRKADGTEVTITLNSLFKDESAENFSYGRDGDTLMLDIGAVNSQTDIEAIIKAADTLKRFAPVVP